MICACAFYGAMLCIARTMLSQDVKFKVHFWPSEATHSLRFGRINSKRRNHSVISTFAVDPSEASRYCDVTATWSDVSVSRMVDLGW